MPLSINEIIADLPQLVALEQNVESCVAALPPKADRKAVDYAVAFKVPPESPVYQLLALIDTVEAQAKSA